MNIKTLLVSGLACAALSAPALAQIVDPADPNLAGVEQPVALNSVDQAAVDKLEQDLANAETDEAKQQILSDALAAAGDNEALSGAMQDAAMSTGMTLAQVLSSLPSTAAGGPQGSPGNSGNAPGQQTSQFAQNQSSPGSVRNFTPPSLGIVSGGGGGGTASGG